MNLKAEDLYKMLAKLSQRAGDDDANAAISNFGFTAAIKHYKGKSLLGTETGYSKRSRRLHDGEIEYDPETGERR